MENKTKTRKIVLSESNLAMFEAATEILKHVSCGCAKKFLNVTFLLADFRQGIQMGAVRGFARNDNTGVRFEIRIDVTVKSVKGDWGLVLTHSLVSVRCKGFTIRFVPTSNGLTYHTPLDDKSHSKLKRLLRFAEVIL